MRYILAATFCSSFVLGLVLIVLMRGIGRKIGFVDRPGGRKQHSEPVVLGGGLAIGAAAWLPVLAAGVLSYAWVRHPGLFPVPEGLRASVERAARLLPVLLPVLCGGLAILLFGLWDDLRPFPPPAKLLVQFLIGGTLALTVPALRITVFIPLPWVHVAITTLWLVLMMNSFNLLDNMDGQAALVGFLTGGALLVLALQTSQYFVAGMLLALLGGVLAFLFFNLPPASIFMGDAGAMFIGYTLAVATTLCTFITPEQVNPVFPLLVPLIVFAVPLYDSLSVLAIRFRHGRPLLAGDRSHFSHRLMRLGMSDGMVLATVGLTVVATAAGATVPYGGQTWRAVVPAVQATAVILVIVQLELMSWRRNHQEADG